MPCIHINQAICTKNHFSNKTTNIKECAYCFNTSYNENGLNLCLTCFSSYCAQDLCHYKLHLKKKNHFVFLNIVTTRVEKESNNIKKTKLEICDEGEQETKFHFKIICLECNLHSEDLPVELNVFIEEIKFRIKAPVVTSESWQEEELSVCLHLKNLKQETNNTELEEVRRCNDCEKNDNLWTCLVCGYVACGRKQYDGTGGNNHAINHYECSKHECSVKMGTFNGKTADTYCYVCDELKLDPNLLHHLFGLGVDTTKILNNELTMQQLQIEHNMKFDFSMSTIDGKSMQNVHGKMLTGLVNLGNTCYLNSVLQSVFHLEEFTKMYYYDQIQKQKLSKHHFYECEKSTPDECIECQMVKIADGLVSARYSTQEKNGVSPSSLKILTGKGHPEFSTSRQQDAFEYYQHFLNLLERNYTMKKETSPSSLFKFEIKQRIKCTQCLHCKYKTDVTNSLSLFVNQEDSSFKSCLRSFFAPSTVEGFFCTKCLKNTTIESTNLIVSFPQVLIVHLRRFGYKDGKLVKLENQLELNDEELDLFSDFIENDHHKCDLIMPDVEEEITLQFDRSKINTLKDMGFDELYCQKALMATSNGTTEAALEWIFQNIGNPDINIPIENISNGGITVSEDFDQESLDQLINMGFSKSHSMSALKETDHNIERALEWIFNHPEPSTDHSPKKTDFNNVSINTNQTPGSYSLHSFISHKGPSVHSGHYICHTKVNGNFVMFNDDKVAINTEPPISTAYILIFTRK